jgi:biotin carboxyl carrier protein
VAPIRPGARRRSVAAMTGAPPPAGRPVRVGVAGAAARPGDEPRTVEPAAELVRLEPAGPGRAILVEPDGRRTPVLIGPTVSGSRGAAPTIEVVVGGWRFILAVEDATRAALRERAAADRPGALAGGPHEIRAVIPGRIVSVAVAPGDKVIVGQVLLVVEAMKMQNDLRATRAGTVEAVLAAAGTTVEVGDRLIVLG